MLAVRPEQDHGRKASASTAAERATSALVRVAGLSKRYRVRRRWSEALRHPLRAEHADALKGVSLSVAEGEVLGLLGPNGAGKTTLLKILSTLVLPDGGSAAVGGHDVVEEPAAVRRLLAPVTADERSLDWRLSAVENLRFFGALHGLRGAAGRERILSVLETVQLEDTGHKIVAAFSSGMRQRLLIARALLSRPRVLLLDEPTRSLDPVAARNFRTFLRRHIAGPEGCSVLLATHNPEEVAEVCNRVAILDHGRLLALGPVGELGDAFLGECYRVWTSTPDHAAFRVLAARGHSIRACGTSGDLATLEIDVAPDDDHPSASILTDLVVGGASIARFEKVEPDIARLIERAVENERGAA